MRASKTSTANKAYIYMCICMYVCIDYICVVVCIYSIYIFSVYIYSSFLAAGVAGASVVTTDTNELSGEGSVSESEFVRDRERVRDYRHKRAQVRV